MAENKSPQQLPKGCGIGCLGVIVFFIIVIILGFTKDERLSAEEIDAINNTISTFNSKAIEYSNSTNGVVKKAEMLKQKDSDTFSVYVYIDEAMWAKATESEKASVAATIGRQMDQLATPSRIYVSLISASNGDTLARPKVTGEGYKIIR